MQSQAETTWPASSDVSNNLETYVCFVHPHQSRHLREQPEFIEVDVAP